MKVQIFQINPTIGDVEGNTRKVLDAIEAGKAEGVDICLFPELTLCGYPPQDLVLHSQFLEAMERAVETVANAAKGIAVVLGLVRCNLEGGEKGLYNSAVVIEDGKVLGYQDKWLLPTYDVFSERRYFDPGKKVSLFEIKGLKVGVLICEDIWQHGGYVSETKYSRDPVEELKQLGPNLLLNLTASPYQFQKPNVRIDVCAQVARTLECPVVYCCQVGANDQLVFDGMSLVVGCDGHLIHQCKGFVEDQFIYDLADESEGKTYDFAWLENLRRALVLGIRDYFQKQGFEKACLGLSGGIDSSVVAALAVEALGAENVLGVMMPSPYSSEGSITDAKKLGENLGIQTELIRIDEPFKVMCETLKPIFKERKSDVTEENIQARIRGNLLMSISNKFGYIVLSTGNKSELALGYCTLYGDMAGGLGVIADVLKTHVYDLARWINQEGPIIPQNSIDKPPSAELRPNQVDLDSLPPYDVIDNVLRGYVEDYLTPEEVAQKYAVKLETVCDLIKRIHAAEYKRQQAAPLIRVSKKSFGVGRKYPIVHTWSGKMS